MKEEKHNSKEEKIIRYFYLLDKEDQVAVLRQICKKIKKDKVILSTSKLELFEEKDYSDWKKYEFVINDEKVTISEIISNYDKIKLNIQNMF